MITIQRITFIFTIRQGQSFVQGMNANCSKYLNKSNVLITPPPHCWHFVRLGLQLRPGDLRAKQCIIVCTLWFSQVAKCSHLNDLIGVVCFFLFILPSGQGIAWNVSTDPLWPPGTQPPTLGGTLADPSAVTLQMHRDIKMAAAHHPGCPYKKGAFRDACPFCWCVTLPELIVPFKIYCEGKCDHNATCCAGRSGAATFVASQGPGNIGR